MQSGCACRRLLRGARTGSSLPAWGATLDQCGDAASCEARMNTIVGRLDTMRDEMRGKHLTLEALEERKEGSKDRKSVV